MSPVAYGHVMTSSRKPPPLKCWCGQKFTGLMAGFRLATHQKKDHPGNPNNV